MDDKRMEAIFAYLENIEIELDPDPIRRGPKYLNNQVAECRNATNEIQKFEREVAREKMTLDRSLNRLEAMYELQFNEFLTTDPEVLQKNSVRDREAAVKVKLTDLMKEINTAKVQITDLGHVDTVIQSKLRELKDVNRDIRLQMRLIEDEIKLGNFWGDQSEDGQHHISNDEIDLDDLNPEDGPVVSKEDADDMFDSEFNTDGSSDDLQAALDNIEVMDHSTDPGKVSPHGDIDYDSLLEGF